MSVEIGKPVAKRSRLRDYALYLLISFLVVGLSLAALFMDVPWDVYMRWFAIIAVTAVVLGQFVASSRSLWHRHLFWVFTGSVCILHVAFTVMIFFKGHSGIHMVWLYLIEVFFFFYARDFFFEQEQR